MPWVGLVPAALLFGRIYRPGQIPLLVLMVAYTLTGLALIFSS